MTLQNVADACTFLGVLRFRDQSFSKLSIGEFWTESVQFLKHVVINSTDCFDSNPSARKCVRSVFFALDATGNTQLYDSGMNFLVEVGFVDKFIDPPSRIVG
jgi:hypothetical protein